MGMTAGFGSALRSSVAVSGTLAAAGMTFPATRPTGNVGRGGSTLTGGVGTTGQISTRGSIWVPFSVLKVLVPFAWRLTNNEEGPGGALVAVSSLICVTMLAQ